MELPEISKALDLVNTSNEPPAQDGSDAGPSGQAVRLSRLQRSAAGLLGSVLLSAGGVAVFLTDNDAGATALLVLGAVFLLISVAGILPSRFRAGDYEVEIGEIVDKAVEAIPDSQERQDFVETLAKSTSGSAREEIGQVYSEHVGYEQRVLAKIRGLLPEGVEMHPTEERPDTYWGDVHLWRDGQQRRVPTLAVEIKYLRSEAFLSARSISQLLNYLGLANEKLGPVRLLVICNRAPSSQTLTTLQQSHASFVLWRDARDDAALSAALRSHFESAE